MGYARGAPVASKLLGAGWWVPLSAGGGYKDFCVLSRTTASLELESLLLVVSSEMATRWELWGSLQSLLVEQPSGCECLHRRPQDNLGGGRCFPK